MDRRFMDCTEVSGKCIERLRCYDSSPGVREIEIQFTDGGMLVLKVANNISVTGDFYETTVEGLAPTRRYPVV
jgi:hypothetical protein